MTPTAPPLLNDLRVLFSECDVDNNGSLTRDEFRQLCLKIGLNEAAASKTFDRLDVDKDERITFEEFAAGFNQYKQSTSPSPTVAYNKQTANRSPSSTNHMPTAPSSDLLSPKHRLSPSGASLAGRGRKSASPLGMMSTGDTSPPPAFNQAASLSNNWQSAGSGGSGFLADGSGGSEFSSVDNSHHYISSNGQHPQAQHDSMIVYSGDILSDTGQCGTSSGQFGSLNSGNSFGQVRNMQDLMECVQKLQTENQILAQVLVKDRKERDEYISQLGEEFDMQVRQVEERYNRRTKEEVESERSKYKAMVQAELEKLQNHYQTFEKMSKLIKTKNNKLDKNGEIVPENVKNKLEDTFQENRKLERSLLDTKSEVALIRDEMERLKRQYEDKLHNAYARNNETKSECDDIKKQLTLMKDSNKKLQDASDAITSYITDTVDPVIKGTIDDEGFLSPGGGDRSEANSRRGSLLSEYLSGSPEQTRHQKPLSTSASRAKHESSEHPSLMKKSSSCRANVDESNYKQTKTKSQRHGEASEAVRDSFANSKRSATSQNSSDTSHQQQQSLSSLQQQASLTQMVEPKQDLVKQTSSSSGSIKNFGRHFFIGSRKQSDAQLDKERVDEKNESAAANICDVEPIVEEADGEVAARFNIILVGDSFVGKSSFAARFMGGAFVQGLISNCSIDFKTKNYKVNGVNYAVDLWDTAGQERFRSITASYFRKADGIVLMYDVTEKRSYLNVRNWMSTISDSASENVAVLLVGNKIDLRKESNKSKCVPLEEGMRLAREYDILFLETSVKTGTNLISSVGKLISLIVKKKVPVEEDTDRIKLNDKSRTFACMPKNC